MVEKMLRTTGQQTSEVASPKIFGGGKLFDTRRITLFSLQKRLSKHKMTIFSKNLGGMAPLLPLGAPMLQTKKRNGDRTQPCRQEGVQQVSYEGRFQ